MMSRSNSKLPIGLVLTKVGRLSASAATATRRTNLIKLAVAFLLVAGLLPHLASSAPTPQEEAEAATGGLAVEEGDAAERVVGPDRTGGSASELRYGWWMSLKENGAKTSAEPPDIPWTNPLLLPPPPPPQSRDDGDDVARPVSHASQSSAPIIHIIADESASHDTSTLSPPPISSPLPADRPITARGVEDHNSFADSVDLDSDSDWIFNIIIQQQRKQRSAYIAPDVNWLRDLVPKVVDVVDKTETHIKETVFNAIDDDNIVEAGHIEDRQIFVNVVKSKVESEHEVPQILTHLRDLMQTGGPAVDSIRSESRDINDRLPKSLIINVIIFNVAAELTPSTEKPNPTAIFRDSYIEALEESRKGVNPPAVATTAAPKKPSQAKPHSAVGPQNTAPAKGGPFFVTKRPQTTMEKDYLRPAKVGYVQPVKSTAIHFIQSGATPEVAANIAEEEEEAEETVFSDSEQIITEIGAGLTLTGPQPPAPPTDDGPQPPAPPPPRPIPRPAPTRRPGSGRLPAAVGNIANTAGSVVRNRVRTMGLVGVPLVAGLASTASFWLPAVTAFGRKKRSLLEEDDSHMMKAKAIDDPSLLALLMGKRYMNISRDALQESIDNWKNRDQEAQGNGNAGGLLTQTRLSSTSRPFWFRLQPSQPTTPTTVETTKQTTAETTRRTTTVKRSTTESMEDGASTGKSPVFYSFEDEEETEMETEEEEEEIEGREDVDLSEYSDFPEPSTSSTTTDYETEETEPREAYPVTVSTYNNKLPSGGFDFDIVANFVRSTLSKMATESIKEEVFHVKSPSIVNSSAPFTTLLLKNSDNRAPSGGGSTQPLKVFTADPIMTNRSDEKVTNSPVTYVSMSINQPAKTSTTVDYDTSSNSDIPSSENVGVPLDFYDEDGSTYYSKEIMGQTVPYSEPFVKSTNKPMPPYFVVNPFELPNTLRTTTAEDRMSTTGSTRPTSLLTIADFKTPKPPAPVDVSSKVPITTLKFNHGGIVTTAPLQDFSTLTGESSLVSATVDKQNILSGLLKGAGSSDAIGQTDRPSSSSTLGDTGLNGMFIGSNSAFNTATYEPFSPTGISDELDVTSLISQLQTNLPTGFVTRPPSGGLHFVNTSTDIVIINPFGDVTPSSIFGPLGIEAVVAEDAVVVDANDASPGDLAPSVPQVSNLANFLFPVSISSSSDSSSSSSSSSSGDSGSGVTTTNFISGLSATYGIGSLASVGVLAVATLALIAVSLPIWVPLVSKKKRRTYGPARKKAKKPPPKKTYGPPKKTYGEPPLNHYKDLDDRFYDNEMIHQPTMDDIYRAEPSGPSLVANDDADYVFRDSIPINADTLFSDPGPLNSEDVYGPPATVFLNARR